MENLNQVVIQYTTSGLSNEDGSPLVRACVNTGTDPFSIPKYIDYNSLTTAKKAKWDAFVAMIAAE